MPKPFHVLALCVVVLATGCIENFVAKRQPAPRTEPSTRQSPPEPPSAAEAPTIERAIVMRNGLPHLQMSVNGEPMINGEAPLHTATQCQVSVMLEPIEEGSLLKFHIVNNNAESAEMPAIVIGGIAFPREEVEILENWKNVHFKKPLNRNQNQLHALRSYPSHIYSPVLGIRHEKLFLGTSLMFDPFDVRKEVNLDYRWDRRSECWTMLYRFWDDSPHQVDDRWQYHPATLQPNQSFEFAIAVTIAQPGHWVGAFRPYRDFFRARYGSVRYTASREPIYAMSLGLVRRIAENNPKGYGLSGPTGNGRLDLIGWRGFYQYIKESAYALGYRRILLWQVAGSYDRHRDLNMAWEIASSWSPVMYETAHELRRLHQSGVQIGFWWGIAFSVSGGFDSGIREPWDPDNEMHQAAAFRELDMAYDMGVRMIGLDATPRSVWPGRWSPVSPILFHRILPMLHKRYPEMHWIIEPAASDFLHVWGSSFMWSGDVQGPTTFADYLIPGHESHAVMKRDRPFRDQTDRDSHMRSQFLKQYLEWGYTPIVFEADKYGLEVDRSLVDVPAE